MASNKKKLIRFLVNIYIFLGEREKERRGRGEKERFYVLVARKNLGAAAKSI